MDERITQELDRIHTALLDTKITAKQHDQLYAAEQALSWVSGPQMARSPYETVMLEPVTAISP